MTCNIKPQILNVTVTYNATGYVTFEPHWQTSTYPPINFTSTVILTIMSALKYHLSNAQAPDMNIAVEGIYDLYFEAYQQAFQDSDYKPLADLMVGLSFSVISRD